MYTRANFDSVQFTDPSRRVISGVWFRTGETVAMNGGILIRIASTNEEIDEPLAKEFMISAQDASDIGRLIPKFKQHDCPLPNNSSIILENEQQSVTFAVGGKRITVVKQDVSVMPNIAAIQPTCEPVVTIAFSINLLRRLVDFLSHYHRETRQSNGVVFKIYKPDAPVVFECQLNDCQHTSGLIMPRRITDK